MAFQLLSRWKHTCPVCFNHAGRAAKHQSLEFSRAAAERHHTDCAP